METDRFEVLRGAIRKGGNADRRLQAATEVFSRVLMQKLRQTQPDGSKNLDPLAAAAGRNPRPSIRLNNIPIAQGWVGPRVRRGHRSNRVTLLSKSAHIIYYTQFPDRAYLGTRGSWPVEAKRKKTLAFFWQGRARFPRVVERKGTAPGQDFVRVAFDEAQKAARAEFGRGLRVIEV